jgi:hypothetical protein
VADDLGVGMSTRNIEHVQRHWSERACERSLRIETRMWCRKKIWDWLKRMTGFFANQKP